VAQVDERSAGSYCFFDDLKASHGQAKDKRQTVASRGAYAEKTSDAGRQAGKKNGVLNRECK